MSEKNPFLHILGSTSPVEGDSFIGRKRLLERLTGRIVQKRQHISLHGMPHVGKSSVLLELERQLKPERELRVVKYALTPKGFKYTVTGLFWGLRKALGGAEQGSRLQACLEIADTVWKRSLTGLDLDGVYLLDLLRAILKETTAQGLRIVFLLDEFERIAGARKDGSGGWTEREYTAFVQLLLDESLDLVCVTASRPTIANLLTHYEQRLDPFVDELVRCFDEKDMKAYFQVLADCGRPIPPGDRRQELLRYCGRSPLLLTIMGNELLCESEEASIPELYREVQKDFDVHFMDIVKFMQDEEAKKQRSFAHIVKCYFGPSADYWDIQERCIGLGYIDLLDPQGDYTYQYDGEVKYRFEDRNGKYGAAGEEYTCLTISPLFVDYLYRQCLEQIEDTRDLLTGLVYTLRDITAYELKKVYGPDWNEKLLLERIVAKSDNKFYCFQREETQFCAKEIEAPPSDAIQISVPVNFLPDAFNEQFPGDMPLLDAVNLTAHGVIIRSYPELFKPYFGGKLGKPFKESMHTLKEARDKIAHYSRHALTPEMEKKAKKMCRGLLKSIYTYISEERG